jgi:hypothetical protein
MIRIGECQEVLHQGVSRLDLSEKVTEFNYARGQNRIVAESNQCFVD